VTALHPFQTQYGIPYPSQPSGYLIPARYLSGWSGAATGGDIIGILIAGQLIELIGRKHSLLVGTVLTAAGIGMQYGSHEWILFLCGRLVNGKHRKVWLRISS
jgi:MFS family permease